MPAALLTTPQVDSIPDDTKVVFYWNDHGLHKLGFFIHVDNTARPSHSPLIRIVNGAWLKKQRIILPSESLTAYQPVKHVTFQPLNGRDEAAGEYGLIPVSTEFVRESPVGKYHLIWVWHDIHWHLKASRTDHNWDNSFTGSLALQLLLRLRKAPGDLSQLSLETGHPEHPDVFQWHPQSFESVL